MFKWLKNVFTNEEEKNKEEVEKNIEETQEEQAEAKENNFKEEKDLEEIEDQNFKYQENKNLEDELNNKEKEETKAYLKEEKVQVDPEINDQEDLGTQNRVIDQEDNQTFENQKDDQVKEDYQSGQIKNLDQIDEPIEDQAHIVKNQDQEEKEDEPISFFKRLKTGLLKTRNEMGVKINTILGQYVKIEDDLLEDLEDTLISADVGMETTIKLIDNLRDTIIQNKINDPNKVLPLLKDEVKKLMDPSMDTSLSKEAPLIILVIGVNGVGKTTTIGKLSSRLKSEGKKVLIAAADTFRAAAIDQLKTWGTRSGVEVIAHSEGADPAAVIFDAIAAAKSRKADVLICDTAGRLHNKANLMKELEKINKVISREYPEAARETLLVLDATTGQNAISQAKTFKQTCDPTGIALTKLDGTAKGGVVIALQSELKLPIKLVGVGEQVEDLQDFDMDNFIDAIFD